MWQSLLLSQDPKYYNRFFDLVHLISGSLATLSKKVTKALPEERKSNQFSDELLTDDYNLFKEELIARIPKTSIILGNIPLAHDR